MKIALFGGSFDPPHAGHDAAVKAILSALKPDLLVIMPSFLNPFKKSFSAPPQLRLRWCRALWSDAPGVEVSDYEISQNRSVSTIQSVKFLLEKHGGNGKIAAEAAAAASETLTAVTDRALPNGANIANKISAGAYTPGSADEILPEKTDGTLSCGIAKISSDDACTADITDGTSIPTNAKNEALQGGIADQISIGSKSEMDGISQSKAGNANDASKILNADKIPSASKIPNGNANCMADTGDANFVGSANSAGDTGGANDMDDASDVSSADEASKANSASGTDAAPKLYIVVGADNLAELHKWRDFSELQKLAEFVVLTRPGYEIPRQWADLARAFWVEVESGALVWSL